MIKLKQLLEQSTNLNQDQSDATEISNVLFLGDNITRSKSSYANLLINSKIVNGRVVAWPDINLKQLNKLLKRYINKKYSIVSILFGDSIIKKIDENTIEYDLNNILDTAKQYGAEVVIIQNPSTKYKDQASILDKFMQTESDLYITNNLPIKSVSTQNKLAKEWISSVNSTFSLKLSTNTKEIDLITPKNDEIEDNSPIKSIIKTILPSNNNTPANYSQSVIDQAYNLIIPFEGFTPIAKKDRDGYCRIGHGSSHVTKEDGTVIDLGLPAPGKSCEETYPYTITVDDAHRDLRRLIPASFIPTVERTIKSWGGDITKLNDATIAALVSVTYNYGHIPSELKAGISASDPAAIGNALLTQFNSKGSNPGRRKKEGQYILDSLNQTPTNQEEPSLWSKVKSHIFNRKASGGATIQFSSRAQQDVNDNILNPNLVDDMKKAAEAAGVTVKVEYARTGHGKYTSSGNISRHWDGLAVDISEINGINWNSKQHAIDLGVYDACQAFVSELEKLGYVINNEYGNDKAVLTFGFKAHNDHIHVSRKS